MRYDRIARRDEVGIYNKEDLDAGLPLQPEWFGCMDGGWGRRQSDNGETQPHTKERTLMWNERADAFQAPLAAQQCQATPPGYGAGRFNLGDDRIGTDGEGNEIKNRYEFASSEQNQLEVAIDVLFRRIEPVTRPPSPEPVNAGSSPTGPPPARTGVGESLTELGYRLRSMRERVESITGRLGL